MFLIKEKRKHGTHLCIVQSFRDPVTKVSKTRRIMNLGYVEELQKQHSDPVSHFQKVAKKMSEEYKQKSKPSLITIDPTKPLAPGDNFSKNFGYAVFSLLYHELKLDAFFKRIQKHLNIDYSLNSVIKLLVYGRILFPGSEKQMFEMKEQFFDKMNFSLNDVYHSFTCIPGYKFQIQSWINKHICENYVRENDKMYYYVTNHYFEIDEQSRSAKEDVSNKYRLDPIVQMGLFTYSNGLPASYELLPSSKGDALTLLSPALKKARRDFVGNKVIIVTDNGSNRADNLPYLSLGGNGYIVTQNIRSADAEIKKFALNHNDYTRIDDDCKVKSRIYTRNICIKTSSGAKKNISFQEKQIVLYNEKWTRCARAEREDMLLKAKSLIASPNKYNKATAYGAGKYVKNIKYDPKTGEILQDKELLYLDEERLRDEEKYDGYYLFLTSQIDESDGFIIDTFNNLWEIEKSFKFVNSSFHSKPSSLSRGNHIHAHFLTCFIAFTLTCMLQMKSEKKYPLEEILKSLQKCNYIHIDEKHYMQSYYDSVLDFVGSTMGIDFSKRYQSLQDINANFNSK